MVKSPISAQFLRRSKKFVQPYLRKARRLDQLPPATKLSHKQRDLIVQQAIILLEGFYAHLPLKRAMYAIDPLRRLRLLRRLLPNLNDDRVFHGEMKDIFQSLRDQHTKYSAPFSDVAWLPFKVESYWDGKIRRYLVSHVAPGFKRSTFRRGVEVLFWNGVPIKRAVELAGARSHGNSSEAQHQLGLQLLTARQLATDPLPVAEWVTIRYRTKRGREYETRVDWAVMQQPPSRAASPSRRRTEIFKFLFKPDVLVMQEKPKPLSNLGGLRLTLPDFVNARIVPTRYGKFGYIRIYSFDVTDPNVFVDEFVQIITKMTEMLPKNGLIIDVRDNLGGRTTAAEMILQLVSPESPIVPAGVYFANTPHILELCKLQKSNLAEGPRGLAPWIESVQRAMVTSAMFSASFFRNDKNKCNSLAEKKYPGNAIVITNAVSYSAAEFFAAGFQDHGGKILGVDGTTGGGGATVRTHDQLMKYFKKSLASPFQKLPPVVKLDVAYRRSHRVRDNAGNDIEDFGVKPDYIHRMTRDDILKHNVDLINCAASYLVKMSQ
jgi:C-terminal processing protease CtpA/Prc